MASVHRFDQRPTRRQQRDNNRFREEGVNDGINVVEICYDAIRQRNSAEPPDTFEKSLCELQARGLLSRIAVGVQKIKLLARISIHNMINT